MLKKSKLFLALMLGGFMFAAIAFASCNGSDTKTETPAADTTAPKMETTPPAVPDTTPKMDTAAPKPLKPGT